MGFRGGGLGSTSRTKRMRTSFKHHQLRTMKSYFAINHNPDAKDLKQLSQKTGLPKRVLQVICIFILRKWSRTVVLSWGPNLSKFVQVANIILFKKFIFLKCMSFFNIRAGISAGRSCVIVFCSLYNLDLFYSLTLFFAIIAPISLSLSS